MQSCCMKTLDPILLIVHEQPGSKDAHEEEPEAEPFRSGQEPAATT